MHYLPLRRVEEQEEQWLWLSLQRVLSWEEQTPLLLTAVVHPQLQREMPHDAGSLLMYTRRGSFASSGWHTRHSHWLLMKRFLSCCRQMFFDKAEEEKTPTLGNAPSLYIIGLIVLCT